MFFSRSSAALTWRTRRFSRSSFFVFPSQKILSFALVFDQAVYSTSNKRVFLPDRFYWHAKKLVIECVYIIVITKIKLGIWKEGRGEYSPAVALLIQCPTREWSRRTSPLRSKCPPLRFTRTRKSRPGVAQMDGKKKIGDWPVIPAEVGLGYHLMIDQ